jgi:hypothetical protein
MNKDRRWTICVTVFSASVLLSLILAEVFLRIAGISYPGFYAPDEHRGWAHRPGMTGRFRSEGRSDVQFSRHGLRDREYPREKLHGTFRIAILGDSYAQALQVPVEQNFSTLLEHRLQACRTFSDRNVEVINFGVASYGTAQEYLTLRYHVRAFAPDAVLLAFLTGNDIEDNSRALSNGLQKSGRPYFEPRGGALGLDTRFRQSHNYRAAHTRRHQVQSWLVDRLCLLQLGREAKRLLARRMRATGTAPLPGTIYMEPAEPNWEEAWRVTERLIVMMRDEAIRNDAQFVVTILSNPIQVHPDPAVRRQAQARLEVENLFYPDRRIQALCEQENIPALSLAQPFQAYAEEHGVCLHGFDNCIPCGGHWNEAGHDLASRMMAEFLCENLPVPSRAVAPRLEMSQHVQFQH